MSDKRLFRNSDEFNEYVEQLRRNSDDQFVISEPESYPCIALITSEQIAWVWRFYVNDFVYLSDFGDWLSIEFW